MKKNIRFVISVIFIFLIITMLFMKNIIADNTDTISVTVKINSNGDTATVNKTGSTISLSGNVFKENPIYCIYSSKQYTAGNFNVESYTPVDANSRQAYIFTLADDYKPQNNATTDITNWFGTKQNLIWYYYDGGSRKSNFAELMYVSNNKNNNIEKEYNNAINYETSAKNFAITVTRSGENINVKWGAMQLATEYKIFINNNVLYKTVDKNTTEINIPISAFTEGSAKIRVEAKNAKIVRAGYYTLKSVGGNKQDLMIPAAEIGDAYDEDDSIQLNTNVSLQKYITKVNGNDLTSNDTNLTDRKNTYTSANENNDLAKKVVSKSEENNMKSANTYKEEKIVNIDVGDTVTYRIYVYNNSSSVNAKNVLIKDTIPYIENNGEVKSLASIENIKDANGNDVEWSTVSNTSDKNSYEYTINELAGSQSTYFDVTLKYNEYSSGIIINTAWISGTEPKNSDEYRTVDRDYVKMKEYKISLEKFVDYVTDKNGGNAVSYRSDREGKRYNDEETTNENKNTYKPEHKVQVEAGDIVTYTIRLKNTGATAVKISQIYDCFDTKTNLVKLEYISDYGIKGNGGGKIVNNNYRGPNNTWTTDNVTRYLIQFDNPDTLEPGKTTDITMQFKVTVPSQLTNQSHILQNNSAIVEFKNKNDVLLPLPSSDGDGIDNNRDADYVQTKTYAVSLEKFVTKVDNTNVTGRDGKRYNDEAETVENKNSYKKDNNVSVEIGDLVTFTIRLKNTGNSNEKVYQIYDSFENRKEGDTKGIKFEYDSNYGIQGNGGGHIVNDKYRGKDSSSENKWDLTYVDRYLIQFDNPVILKPGETTDITVRFRVIVPPEFSRQPRILSNRACVVELRNRNDINVLDGDGWDNNRDADYVQTKIYAVSLEKFVYKVNGYEMCDFDNGGTVNILDADLLRKYISEYNSLDDENVKGKISRYGDLNGDGNIDIVDYQRFTHYLAETENSNIKREGHAEHNYDDNTSTNNPWKSNHIVTVSKGDKVTYKIKLMNDGETDVYITKVKDFFPNGVTFGNRTFNGNEYDITKVVDENGVEFEGNNISAETILQHGKSKAFEVTITVNESNMSLNILKNTATITQMKNKNKFEVQDTTPNNNTDSDYLQLNHPTPPPEFPNDVPIAGMVWVDKNQAKDNNQNGYNALYQGNGETENKLSGVVVKLYRNGVNSAIATKITDGNGYYYFEDKDIDKNVVPNRYERYIKGPMVSNEVTRWAGTYYSYHIEFEYDGITYTSTPDGKSCVSVTDNAAYNNGTYKINSNANEEFNARKEYNNKFSPINKDSLNGNEKIDYTTKNENGYIPQSIHNYKPFMTMKSSTGTIQLDNNPVLEEEIKYINLGLRGRDLFDLELTSDVAKIDVNVNGVNQTYESTNKATVRKSDLNANTNITEDMANIENENSNKYVDEYNEDGQKLRNTDKPYLNSVYVTYKITVQNTSKTNGTATKIINYYDNVYKFERAYSGNTNLNTSNSNSGDGYKSVIIDTPQTNLSQSATMDIYVVYRLENVSVLKSLNNNDKLPTYNMSEIYEYRTFAKDDNNEYVRGLIDKDSAPGSVATENVRLAEGNSNLSTVNYYFSKQGLNKLKYEDDTYATPTLYFVSDGNARTLTGYVFEDSIDQNILKKDKIKTGNGIKDAGEKGIKGVTVILHVAISMNDNRYIEYKATTGDDGKYTISNFIPGENADLTYWYGDKDATFCKVTNGKSYNGEDFESANNSGISNKENYWYIVNSNKNGNALSIATDIESDGTTTEVGTRKGVSSRVSKYGDDKLEVLNKVRLGTITQTTNGSDERKIREDTKMHSKTPKFILTVEKANENGTRITNGVETYEVPNMNFGIQEVPVTTLDLKSTVKELVITDAAGDNIIASAVRELNSQGKWTGKWKVTGNILAPTADSNASVSTSELTKMLDVSIEEEKLQGAKLKIKYEITAEQQIERDFKGNDGVKASITGLVDYVDNDLSYSADSMIGNNTKNSNYWEVTTYDATQEEFKNALKARGEDVSNDKKYGSIDPEGKEYTTILKASSQNPLITSTSNSVSCDLVLEKVLSAHDNTLSDIVASTVETYDYNNKVEITGLNYKNTNYKVGETTIVNADRIRTPKLNENDANYSTESWMTILPGINRYASAVSEDATIHPPTGDSTEHNNIVYYLIATVSLAVLAVGVILIKKFAVKKD